MQNFQGYRDDLAKNLKEIRKTDAGKAQNVLNEASNTEEYKAAKADNIEIHEQIKTQDDFERMDKERARFNKEVIEHSQMAEENSDNWTEDEIARYEAEVYGKIRFSDVEAKMKNYPKDVERISNVLGEKDLEKCTALWIQHSNSISAGWLHLPEDDEEEKGDVALLNILKDIEKYFSPSDIIRNTSKEKIKNSDIEQEENIKAPEAGDKIYVPSSGSFSSPKEDVAGGLATINTIEKIANGDYIITVIEHPNPKYQYSFKKLLSEQDDLMNTYKGKVAKIDSDSNVYSENDWKKSPGKDDSGWVQSK